MTEYQLARGASRRDGDHAYQNQDDAERAACLSELDKGASRVAAVRVKFSAGFIYGLCFSIMLWGVIIFTIAAFL